jgi:hypothetical protein
LIDRVLDEEISDLKSFVDLWHDFFGLATEARADEERTKVAEGEFIGKRDSLAQRYRALMERLEISTARQSEVINLLSRFNSVKSVASMADTQWKRIEESRASVEVLLQGLLGVLQNRRTALEAVSRSRIVLRAILLSWPLKLLYVALGVIMALLVLNMII